MPLRPKTINEMNREAFDFLIQSTNGAITMLAPGGIARALIETNNRHVAEFQDNLTLHQTMSYVSTASGQYLDLIAELLGLTRRQAGAAVVATEDAAIRFYVTSGTLYDRLPQAGNLGKGVIPAGTTVQNADSSVLYIVEEDVVFPRTATEVFVPARSSTTGSGVNVGALTLRSHGLGVSGVLVTNPVSITTGRDRESDDDFRARIRDRVRSLEGANEAAVRLAVLSAPGVADVRIVPFVVGAGSFDVLIVPTGNRVAKETIEVASRNLSETVAFGMFYRVREPKYVRFSMVISLTFRDGVLKSEKDSVRALVEQAILNYMGNLRMGRELVITQLGAAITNSDPRVKDYDIQALCINGKPQLLHNYQLASDELFLPDEGLSDPVRIS